MAMTIVESGNVQSALKEWLDTCPEGRKFEIWSKLKGNEPHWIRISALGDAEATEKEGGDDAEWDTESDLDIQSALSRGGELTGMMATPTFKMRTWRDRAVKIESLHGEFVSGYRVRLFELLELSSPQMEMGTSDRCSCRAFAIFERLSVDEDEPYVVSYRVADTQGEAAGRTKPFTEVAFNGDSETAYVLEHLDFRVPGPGEYHLQLLNAESDVLHSLPFAAEKRASPAVRQSASPPAKPNGSAAG